MELSDDELALLYRLFRTMDLVDRCASDYMDCEVADQNFLDLVRKIKGHIEAKGSEWMRGKGIPWWW
jgi:hypothetical protein